MSTYAAPAGAATHHPVDLRVAPAPLHHDRLTTAFRIFLAIPHLLLVGAPIAITISTSRGADGDPTWRWGVAGVLGAVAGVCALIGWFAILFTGRYPDGLRALVAYYLRWRVRATAYVALLRDEYPPFGDAPYPVELALAEPTGPRDRVSVGFRPFLVIPHVLAVAVLGIAWMVTTMIAWFAILFTGRYPGSLYRFGVGVQRWSTRAEAYLLLLHDEFPPFSLD